MADKVRKETDEELKRIKRKLRKVYQEAYDSLNDKWNSFMEESGKQIKELEDAHKKIIASGDNKAIKKSEKKIQEAKKNATLRNKYYKEMVDETTDRLAHANQEATDIVNKSLPYVYALSATTETEVYTVPKRIEDRMKSTFTLADKHTVQKRIKDGDIKLPKKKVEVPKDKRWNTKRINSQVLQGIQQGESIEKIAERLKPIVNNNEASAMRLARTLVNGAENQGRLDRYKELEAQGAVMQKIWSATPDGRTRDWHLDMDEQAVDLDKPFVDGLGNELDYPGDTSGAPETVYNCRCSMYSEVIGFKGKHGINYIDYDKSKDPESLHQKQIREEKERRAKS